MKLTPEDVRLMRELATPYSMGLIKLLAREFGVSAHYAGRIVRGVAR